MDERRFKKLKSRLYAAEPLIGGLLRLWAVKELARDASPQAIQELAEFIPYSDPSPARDVALTYLRGITAQPAIDIVCGTWAMTRHDELSRLLEEQVWVANNPPRVRALTALKLKKTEIVSEGDQSMAATLIQACRDEDQEIAERAQQCLLNLRNPGLIDEVCARWAKSRDPLLARFIVSAKLIAGQPAGVRALTALKAGRLEYLTAEGAEAVESLVQACEDADSEIAERAQEVLLELRNPDAQDALCRYFIAHDHVLARGAAIAAGYAPIDVNQRALFFFLTAQWEKYESLDFDHSLLRLVYEAADEDMRRRVAERARSAGRIEWVEIAAGGKRGLRLGEMKDAEWEVVLAVLSGRRRWAEMWRLAQDGPAAWAGPLLLRLKEAGWRPERESEVASYSELITLAEAGWELLESLKEGHPASAKPDDKPIQLAISSDGRMLAVECERGDLLLLRMPEGALHRRLIAGDLSSGFNMNRFSCLVFSRDGSLLAGKDYGNAISLWRTVDGQPLRTPALNGDALAAFDISADGGMLASLEYSYSDIWDDDWVSYQTTAELILRSLPDGAVLGSFDVLTEVDEDPRALAFSPNGQMLAISQNSGAQLLGAPGGEVIAELTIPYGSIDSLVFSDDGQWLAALDTDHRLRVWRLPNGEELPIQKGCDHRIRSFAVSYENGVLVTLTLAGIARWHKLHDGALLHTTPTTIRSYEPIAISSDGQTLVRARKEGDLRRWNLETWRLSRMPVALAGVNELTKLRRLLQTGALTDAERGWLRFVEALIRRKLEFDIEVGDAPHVIEIGEFDIEIEE